MSSNSDMRDVALTGRHSEPVFVFMAYLFGQFLVLSLSGHFPGEHPLLVASITSTLAAAAAAVLAGSWIDRHNGGKFIGKKNIPLAQYVICLLAGATIVAIVYFLVLAVPDDKPANPMMAKAFLDKGPAILFPWIASVVVAAPIGEEMVFRGAVQGHLAQRFGSAAAVAVGALLFVLLHVGQLDGYWPTMLGLLILGISAGAARIWTGSLTGAILVHVAYNSVMMAAVLAAKF